jgi:hypothetical protein
MAGYSGKPVVQKLGIKPGFRIFGAGLSVPYCDVVGEFPDEVTLAKLRRHRTALPLGLVDIKACTIDDLWSGLKFVIPKDQRTGRPK